MNIVINYFFYLLFWLSLTGVPTGGLTTFFALAAPLLNLYIVNKIGLLPQKIRLNSKFISYSFWLLKEIIYSTIDVLKLVSSGYKKNTEAVINIKHQQKNDCAKVVYANSITLTPGTITLAIADDKFAVHGLDKSFLTPLKGQSEMASKVKEVALL